MTRDTLSRRDFVRGLGASAVLLAAAAAPGAEGAAAAPATDAPTPRPAAAGQVRFGVQTPPQHVTWQQIADAWALAEELGYDSAFTYDHFMPIFSDPNGTCLEGWSLLGALAARTQRLKIGVLVTGNIYRSPVVVAKMAATLDHVSNGRLILGMGAGWFEQECTAYGFPFYTVGGRARRLDEALQLMKLLFTQPRSSFQGKYYTLVDAPFEPKSVQRPWPPILIGGVGPKLIQPIVAKHADIWNFFADPDIAKMRALCEHFDGVCRRVGRDPAAIEKSAGVRPTMLEGSPAEVRARLQALVDLGVRHFIIALPQPYDLDLLRRVARDVIPAFREKA